MTISETGSYCLLPIYMSKGSSSWLKSNPLNCSMSRLDSTPGAAMKSALLLLLFTLSPKKKSWSNLLHGKETQKPIYKKNSSSEMYVHKERNNKVLLISSINWTYISACCCFGCSWDAYNIQKKTLAEDDSSLNRIAPDYGKMFSFTSFPRFLRTPLNESAQDYEFDQLR